MTLQSNPLKIPRGHDTRLDPVPRLVLFDLDNTLCDHATSLTVRVRHAFEPFFEGDELDRAVAAAIARATEGTAHYGDILREYGVETANAAEEARERYVSDRYRGLELYHDSLESIERIREIADIGLITNGPTDIQQPKIDLLQIEHYFPIVLISERVGIWKPDPAIFEMALDMAGIPAADAIYVGDSHIADVPGAQAAGMRAVWMNRARVNWPGEAPPDIEVHDLFELLYSLGVSH